MAGMRGLPTLNREDGQTACTAGAASTSAGRLGTPKPHICARIPVGHHLGAE